MLRHRKPAIAADISLGVREDVQWWEEVRRTLCLPLTYRQGKKKWGRWGRERGREGGEINLQMKEGVELYFFRGVSTMCLVGGALAGARGDELSHMQLLNHNIFRYVHGIKHILPKVSKHFTARDSPR